MENTCNGRQQIHIILAWIVRAISKSHKMFWDLKIGNLSCIRITSCLVLPRFLMDTFLISSSVPSTSAQQPAVQKLRMYNGSGIALGQRIPMVCGEGLRDQVTDMDYQLCAVEFTDNLRTNDLKVSSHSWSHNKPKQIEMHCRIIKCKLKFKVMEPFRRQGTHYLL